MDIQVSQRIPYGRREGRQRSIDLQSQRPVGFMARGIDPKEVVVLQPSDWKRIQNNLSKYNKELEQAKKRIAEREGLHERSKEVVKNWGNTIEGQRLKRLQAREIREEQEEHERKQIDLEEARLQAEKRKQAIDRAKTLQYYQTDRVKGFHGALLLTEVMKERDAQIEMKKGKKDREKEYDKHLARLHQRELEEVIKKDQEQAVKRYHEKRSIAEFQINQMQERVDETEQEKLADKEEGKFIKAQVDKYEQVKRVTEENRKMDKIKLMESNKRDVIEKQQAKEQQRLQEEQEEEKIRKFVNAKRKMTKMRKDKEQELFQAFQDNTDRMREKLQAQIQQQVDDLDERIAKAVQERESKRLEEETKKEKKYKETLNAIKEHRIEMIKRAEDSAGQEKLKDEQLLALRKEEDRQFHKKMQEKKLREKERSMKLKDFHEYQINARRARHAKELDDQLELDRQNEELLMKEEQEFQEYAQQVINEASARKRNPYPLKKAAIEGPGGGRGPKFDGKAGVRPSYLVSDATGVQLPYYRKDADISDKVYGHVGKSGKRLGFTW